MKTNSKEVKTVVQAYILKSIDFSNYGDIENTVINVFNHYKSESAPIRPRETLQDHFIDFLMGLPSYLNIEYYDDEILKIMVNEWGLPQPANKSNKDSSNLFYYLIFREFIALLKKEGGSIYA